ncbi:MAG: branched-chain amino acid ABC transporter permease [Thermodesulfobacteriota bacterium]
MSLWKNPVASRYEEDMVILNYPLLRIWVHSMGILALALPFILSDYHLHIVNLGCLATISAIALNIVTGYTGLISLGTGGFLCAGAFVVAVLSKELQSPFWINILAAALTGGLLGFIAGLPALRLKGIYLLLGTLAIHFLIVYACGRYQILRGHIGGIPIQDPDLGFGFVLGNSIRWYFFIVLALCAVTLFCLNLERSHVVRAWIALRDKDVVANILGVNIGRYKLLSFTFSSAVISAAGGLSAYYNHFVAYEEFTLWVSIMYLAMIIIGGAASIAGSYFGAFTVVLLPFFLHWVIELLPLSMRAELSFSAIELSVFGLIMILFLLFEPKGLMGIWRLRMRPYFELWPFRYRRAIATRR